MEPGHQAPVSRAVAVDSYVKTVPAAAVGSSEIYEPRSWLRSVMTALLRTGFSRRAPSWMMSSLVIGATPALRRCPVGGWDTAREQPRRGSSPLARRTPD